MLYHSVLSIGNCGDRYNILLADKIISTPGNVAKINIAPYLLNRDNSGHASDWCSDKIRIEYEVTILESTVPNHSEPTNVIPLGYFEDFLSGAVLEQ